MNGSECVCPSQLLHALNTVVAANRERLDPALLRYVATDREIKPGARPFVEKCGNVIYTILYTAPRFFLSPNGSPKHTTIHPASLSNRLDYDRALARYPTTAIVLCSWMPMGEDWTAALRAPLPVQEYILIGESGKSWFSFLFGRVVVCVCMYVWVCAGVYVHPPRSGRGVHPVVK